MFKKSPIRKEIERLSVELATMDALSDEYVVVLRNLEKLRAIEKGDGVSKDTWVNAGVNLAGIALILKHEELNVISTKALGFVRKLKL